MFYEAVFLIARQFKLLIFSTVLYTILRMFKTETCKADMNQRIDRKGKGQYSSYGESLLKMPSIETYKISHCFFCIRISRFINFITMCSALNSILYIFLCSEISSHSNKLIISRLSSIAMLHV